MKELDNRLAECEAIALWIHSAEEMKTRDLSFDIFNALRLSRLHR